MIEYNYSFSESLESKIVTYDPNFPKKINGNVAKIIGKNSSGKTTLMNLIAISTYGHDDGVPMTKSLKNRVVSLYESNYHDFNFSMRIEARDVTLNISSVKKTIDIHNSVTQIEIFESIDGGKANKLTKEAFMKKYRLIYDMPDRPLDRIYELIQDFSSSAKNCKEYVYNMRREVRDTLSQIHDTNIEEKIKGYEISKEKFVRRREEIKSEKLSRETLLEDLEKVTVAKEFKISLDEYRAINKEMCRSSKDERKKEKDNRKEIEEYNRKELSTKAEIKAIVDIYADICTILLEEQHPSVIYFKKYCDKISLDLIFSEKKFPDGFYESCNNLYFWLNGLGDKSDGMRKLSEKSAVLKNLISVIDPYCNKNISIMDQTLKDIQDKLKKELNQINEMVEHNKQILSSIANTDRLIKKISKITKDLSELGPKPKKTVIGDDKDFEQMLNEAASRLNNVRNKAYTYEVYEDNYLKILEDAEQNEKLAFIEFDSIPDLYVKIDDEKKVIYSLNEPLEECIKGISFFEGKISGLAGEKKHRLSNFSFELKKLKTILDHMYSSIDWKSKILDGLANERKLEIKADDSIFLEKTWRILGNRFGKIIHVGEMYEVDRVDLFKRAIFTKDGAVIRFSSMGTGESQLAYTLGLLNSSDDRKIIALLDEVNLMDPEKQDIIFTRLNELYFENKLILGLMAAPDGDDADGEILRVIR